MDETRFINLYNALYSHIEFCNYLESYGEYDIDLTKINYNQLIAIFLTFYFTFIIDQYIEKIEDGTPIIHLIPEFLDQVVSLFAEKYGNGWKIGNLSYKNSSVLLDKIRNKLAHGDYIIENGDIIFWENNQKGIINIDELFKAIECIDLEREDRKEYGEKTTIKINFKKVRDKKVYGDWSFEEFCKDSHILFIKNEPLQGYKRSLEYCNLVEQIENEIIKVFENNFLDDTLIKEILYKNKDLLNNYGIKISYELSSIYDLKYYEEIKKFYAATKEFNQELHGIKLGRFLSNEILKLSKGQNQSFNLSKGILLDLKILKILKDNPNLKFNDLFYLNSKFTKVLLNDIDNGIVSAYLTAFNALYQYGLEKGYTEKGKFDLAKIITGKSLDFSKLDLKMLDCEDLKLMHNSNFFEKSIESYQKKLTIFEHQKQTIEHNYNQFLSSVNEDKRNPEKINTFIERIDDITEKINDLKNDLNNMNYYNSLETYSKYIRNLSIIEYIRNSLSHGNTYLDECDYSDDIGNKRIIIRNYDLNGILAYDKTITVEDFASIFSIENVKILYDFLINNISDISQVDIDYMNILDKRIKERQKRLK